MGSSTNCSTPPCLRTRSLLLMWSPCICIVVPLKMRLLMKIWNRILIVGVAIPQMVKRHGKLSANGFGICAWSWAISFILTRHAQPCLPLPLRLLELLRIWRRGEEKDATLKAGGFHEQNATGLHQRIQAAGRRTF